MENEANQANYEEVEGHLKLLNARLSQMLPSGSPGLATMQDLEDYYERAVSLRVMQNATLAEQLKETEKKVEDAQYKNKLAVRALWIVLFYACAFAIECVWPGLLLETAKGITPSAIVTHVIVLCVAWWWK